jgi:hypothetical protein
MEATITFNIITTEQTGEVKLTISTFHLSQAKTAVFQSRHFLFGQADTRKTMGYLMMKSRIQ